MQIDLSKEELETLTISLRAWAIEPKPKAQPPIAWKEVGNLYKKLMDSLGNEAKDSKLNFFDNYIKRKASLAQALAAYRVTKLISRPVTIVGAEILHLVMQLETYLNLTNLEYALGDPKAELKENNAD